MIFREFNVFLGGLAQRGHAVFDRVPVFLFVFGRCHGHVAVTLQRVQRAGKIPMRQQPLQRGSEGQILFVLRLQFRQERKFVRSLSEIRLRQMDAPLRLAGGEFAVLSVVTSGIREQSVRPGLRIGQALQERMEIRDHGPHVVIPAGRGVAVQEGAERWIVRVVAALHQFVQRLAAQDSLSGLITDRQVRFDPDHVVIAVHDLQREAGKRADVRPAQQAQLRTDVPLAFRRKTASRQLSVEGIVDPLLHLRGGGIRERDDQHVLQADVLVADEPDHALHQDGRLAGSCGGGDQQALMPCRYCFFLFVCPGHFIRSQHQLYTTKCPICGTIEAQPARFLPAEKRK